MFSFVRAYLNSSTVIRPFSSVSILVKQSRRSFSFSGDMLSVSSFVGPCGCLKHNLTSVYRSIPCCFCIDISEGARARPDGDHQLRHISGTCCVQDIRDSESVATRLSAVLAKACDSLDLEALALELDSAGFVLVVVRVLES